jgi:hypothetical protein
MMKHINPVSKTTYLPVKASLLEIQQKVAVLGTFAIALNTLGQAIGTWIGLTQKD